MAKDGYIDRSQFNPRVSEEVVTKFKEKLGGKPIGKTVESLLEAYIANPDFLRERYHWSEIADPHRVLEDLTVRSPRDLIQAISSSPNKLLIVTNVFKELIDDKDFSKFLRSFAVSLTTYTCVYCWHSNTDERVENTNAIHDLLNSLHSSKEFMRGIRKQAKALSTTALTNDYAAPIALPMGPFSIFEGPPLNKQYPSLLVATEREGFFSLPNSVSSSEFWGQGIFSNGLLVLPNQPHRVFMYDMANLWSDIGEQNDEVAKWLYLDAPSPNDIYHLS